MIRELTVSTRVWWQVLRGNTSTSPGRMTNSVGFSFLASGYFCSNVGGQQRQLCQPPGAVLTLG